MAGKFRTSHSLAVLKLFEKAPNLIAQLTLKSVTENSDFTSGLVALNLNGYSANMRRFYNYARDTYPIGLPKSSRFLTQVNEKELNRVTQLQAREIATLEEARISIISKELYEIYLDAKADLRAAEAHSERLLANVQTQLNQALVLLAYYQKLKAEDAPQEKITAARIATETAYGEYLAAQTVYYNSLTYNSSLMRAEDAAFDDYSTAEATRVLAEQIAKSGTVTIIEYNMTNTPSNYRKIWEWVYYSAGLLLPTSYNHIEGSGLITNFPGHYPKMYVEEVIDTSEPSIIAKVITSSGSRTQEFTIEGYPIPPSGAYYLEVDYAIDQLGETASTTVNQFVWNYDMGTHAYPDLYPANAYGSWDPITHVFIPRKPEELSDCVPIVIIKDDKQWIDTNPDTRNFEEESAEILLEKIAINLPAMVTNFEEAEGSEDMDAVYIMFAANLTSKEPSTIRYLMRFFESMQKDINIYPGFQYDADSSILGKAGHYTGTLSLEEQLAAYDLVYPGVPSVVNMVYGGYSTYKFDVVLANSTTQDEHYEEGEHDFQCSIRTGFIYTGIIDGLMEPGAKRGDTMSVWQVGGLDNQYIARASPNTGTLNSGIEYREQIEDNKYKVVRVHNPVISYENFWGGREASYMQTEIFMGGTTSKYVDPDDPYANFVIPLNHDVVKTFSNTTETKIYYDTGIALIFTVILTFIPGWQTFLKVLLFIVLIIIIILAPPVGLSLLGMVVVIAVVSLVVAIVAEILTAVLSSELAAKVNTGLAIAVTILSLGVGAANLVNLVSSIIELTVQLLGAVTQMVSGIASIISAGMGIKIAGVMQDTQLLIEQMNEESEEFEAQQLAMFGEDLVDPLMPGNGFDPHLNPSTYFAERLIPNPGIAIYATVQNFYQLAYKLPELSLNESGSVEER